ncbi:ATP-dependent helicase HrpB [mine drainage metagenome]|uniref:ATP-dependent helicase HrpB n=1 Tax=mine drainage metagenome TaxID=410659 RepID=T1BWN8_9ZZZZ
MAHPAQASHMPPQAQLRRAVQQALQETDGDVLVFLPGRREIAQARMLLQQAWSDDERGAPEIVPLHGALSLGEQHAALAPGAAGTRRVILATNLAESSVTLPGIRAVVDSGLAREPRFDPNTGFTRLQTVRIAQDSADQRAGRAGRVAPGLALRLWPQSQRLEPARTPEIMQAELSGVVLELAAWGSAQVPWLDAPPAGALAQAQDLLCALGALDGAGHITATGRALRALGATPRLAAAALRAPANLLALMADLLALIEARSPLRGAAARSDDLRMTLSALHAWRDRRRARGAGAWCRCRRAGGHRAVQPRLAPASGRARRRQRCARRAQRRRPAATRVPRSHRAPKRR